MVLWNTNDFAKTRRITTPLGTIKYEIAMLRHCAETLEDKRARLNVVPRSSRWTEEQREYCLNSSEYRLGIEGFLLHLRGLLSFFLNKQKVDKQGVTNDLAINDWKVWNEGRAVNEQHLNELNAKAEQFNKKYEFEDEDGKKHDCFDEISKFLAHPTTYRHDREKRWPIAQMFIDVEPIVMDFARHYFPSTVRALEHPILGDSDNSTYTHVSLGSIFPDEHS